MNTNLTTTATAPIANDIHDIKLPVEITDGWTWFWWSLFALIILLAVYLLWRWKNRGVNVVLPPPIPAHVRAKKQLNAALTLIAQPKPFVIAVSDAARTYLEERFNFHAPD